MTQTLYAKNEGGLVKLLRTSDSTFQRTLGKSGAINCMCVGEYTSIVYADGNCYLYKSSNGTQVRKLGDSNAKLCVLDSEYAAIYYSNGQTKLYKLSNGSFVRNI